MNVLLCGRTAYGRGLPSEENIHNSVCVDQVSDAAEYASR
jgi:hypothetical protein